jgi:hypothetical protein
MTRADLTWPPRRGIRTTCLILLCSLAPAAWAGQAESEAAVARILFDSDMENVSYKVRADGFVDILFGMAVGDAEYGRILEKLRSDPDIKGVLPGKSSTNYCPIK